ncbi:HDOD domain-containing protein [Chitinimonas koreensis]|uniref:HDOD domain-containing protein n=1 Tax=Chitinimonas koreensis TaxID=356302 RepID=UPI0003F7C9DA|nr:HDOD domain-containing protein [Chitinimonas koreensis]QNM97194.1 HDOD domain-containing protein [Chitinimonas koreensis]
MIDQPLGSIDAWMNAFESAEIPILQHTQRSLADLAERDADLTARELGQIAAHDALLVLQTLRHLQQHRSSHQVTDVATVERAILMLGVTPLLNRFARNGTIESALTPHPHGLSEVRRMLFRSHHAALCAATWAGFRHDIDEGEVVTAALLKDVAEILVCCFAPKLILRIRAMQQRAPQLDDHVVQKAVFGFPLQELQLALIARWKLPNVLKLLMDEQQAEHPRARTVLLATAYARHAARGWNEPELAADLQAIASLTGLGLEKAEHVTLQACRKAFENRAWYGDIALAPPPELRLPGDDIDQ